MNNDYLDYLQHHGIKGQKWGVRRYQNTDGSLTPAGVKRYRDGSVSDEYKSEVEYNSRKNSSSSSAGYDNGLKRHELEMKIGSKQASEIEDYVRKAIKSGSFNAPAYGAKLAIQTGGGEYGRMMAQYADLIAESVLSEIEDEKKAIDQSVERVLAAKTEKENVITENIETEKVISEEYLQETAYNSLKNTSVSSLSSDPKYTTKVDSGKVYVKNNQSFLSRVVSQVKQMAKKVSNWLSNLFTTSSSKKWS